MKQHYKWYADAASLAGKDLEGLGKTMIVAPHQDDESLGCGGTIALLRNAGVPVHVMFVTNGSQSHPNSVDFPAHKLIALREQEAMQALLVLGVTSADITFLRLPDGALPSCENPGFKQAVRSLTRTISGVKPETIFVPWRRDPHPDHRATWQMTEQAIDDLKWPVRKLEYLIWLWERADDADLPQPGEMKVWAVDIQNVANKKKKAIAAHISQTTRLISDDPDGFILSAEVLAHFDKTTELFVEKI